MILNEDEPKETKKDKRKKELKSEIRFLIANLEHAERQTRKLLAEIEDLKRQNKNLVSQRELLKQEKQGLLDNQKKHRDLHDERLRQLDSLESELRQAKHQAAARRQCERCSRGEGVVCAPCAGWIKKWAKEETP